MIELTVAMPIWNSKHITWLAMESLCRQEKPDFEWELIIAEEQINEVGVKEIKTYIDRLKEVNCTVVKYFPLDFWIPLPQKWKLLGKEMADTSKGFLLQATDCYSEPKRVIRTMEKLKEGHDWIQNRTGYFYSIHYKKIMQFDQTTFGNGCKTGLNMAAKADLVRDLPASFIKSGVDNWIYKTIAPKSVCWIDDEIPNGLDTDGHNNISSTRRHCFGHIEPPFIRADVNIHDILPSDIADRLDNTPPREAFPETYKIYDPNSV